MIASLDVPTLAFVASLVFLAVAFILLLVYLTRRVYAGFGHWLLWQFCATAGVLAFALRGPDPSPTMLILTNVLLLAGPPLLFHGMAQFYQLYSSPLPVLANYGIAAAAIAAQSYFSLLVPDLDARVAVYSLTRSIILLRCAAEPLQAPAARRSPSFWALAAVLAVIICNDLHHAWVALGPGPVANPDDSDSIRRALVGAVAADVLAAYILVLLNSERLEVELRAARRDIEVLARTDSLTGLWNRRHFEDTVEAEIERARRYGMPLSLLALDADRFKRINDEFGHHAGDTVLRELAQLLAGRIRRSDVLCRWGGEEFMVLLPGTDLGRAVAMAEKIREDVAAHGFAPVGRVTVSIGIGAVAPGEDAETWLRRVDAALYGAKLQGRDRVAVAAAAPHPETAA